MYRLLLVAASLFAVTAAAPTATEHQDPPLRLTLRIDGQDHSLLDGQEVLLTIEGKQQKVKVMVAPTRRFDGAGVQFDFPRDMPLEFEHDDPMRTWTLDGTDVTVMLFALGLGRAEMAKTILDSQSAALGVEVAAPTATTLDLGGVAHAAFEVRVEIAGTTMHMLAADVRVGDGAVTLVVQDSLTDDGARSADCARMLDLLAKTWQVTAAK